MPLLFFLQQGPAAVTVRLTQRTTAPPAPAITLGLVRIMLATTFVSAPLSPTTPTPLASQAASRSLGCQHADALLFLLSWTLPFPQITTGPDSGTESCSSSPQHLLHCRTGTIYCMGLGSLSSMMLWGVWWGSHLIQADMGVRILVAAPSNLCQYKITLVSHISVDCSWWSAMPKDNANQIILFSCVGWGCQKSRINPKYLAHRHRKIW